MKTTAADAADAATTVATTTTVLLVQMRSIMALDIASENLFFNGTRDRHSRKVAGCLFLNCSVLMLLLGKWGRSRGNLPQTFHSIHPQTKCKLYFFKSFVFRSFVANNTKALAYPSLSFDALLGLDPHAAQALHDEARGHMATSGSGFRRKCSLAE